MGTENDYDRILGVLDDAEDIVIRAAYRALAQRYHPDKWEGDQAEATRRMVEINAAYAVLSDTAKRAAYDSTRDKNQFNDESQDVEDESQTSAVNKDWEIVKKYHPSVLGIERQLHWISHELGFTFRLILLENKEFEKASEISRFLEGQYFSKYFGKKTEVHAFAKELILEGRRDAAKELNEAVRVLGNVDAQVIKKIASEFNTERFKRGENKSDRERWTDSMAKGTCPNCNALIAIGVPVCPKCKGVIETMWRGA